MRLNTQSALRDNTVIFLFGPTAAGKTRMLCQLFSDSCEVVNADSVQVYRHLDIGSAKADSSERSLIKHHLIDIREPWESWNVKNFVEEADKACSAIRLNGRIPVISGGTAFYMKSFICGLSDAPPSDPQVREQVSNFIKTEGGEAAYTYLQTVDPVSAETINRNDLYRISRAIEVYKVSGRALSSFRIPSEPRSSVRPVLIGLSCDRKKLAERIRKRVELMFDAGLEDEIRKLKEMGADASWQSMQAIGYREFMSAGNEYDPAEVAEQIVMNSIHYAKRQMTFFRSFPDVHWFDCEDADSVGRFLEQSRLKV